LNKFLEFASKMLFFLLCHPRPWSGIQKVSLF